MSLRDTLLGTASASASVSKALARFTGLLIIILMIGVVVDSVLRGVLGIAVWGVLEFSTFMLLALIFLGLPATQAERVNFRVSVFADLLPRKVGLGLGALLIVLQLAALGMLCWFTWRSAVYSITREEVSMGLVGIPLWPHRVLVSLGLTLVWWQTLMSLVELSFEGRHPYALDAQAEVEAAIGRKIL